MEIVGMDLGRSQNLQTTALLTPDERDFVQRRTVDTNAPSLSAVVNKAIRDYLTGRDLWNEGICLPSAKNQDTIACGYMLEPEVVRLLQEAKTVHRWPYKLVMRAAIFAMMKTLRTL